MTETKSTIKKPKTNSQDYERRKTKLNAERERDLTKYLAKQEAALKKYNTRIANISKEKKKKKQKAKQARDNNIKTAALRQFFKGINIEKNEYIREDLVKLEKRKRDIDCKLSKSQHIKNLNTIKQKTKTL